MTMSSLQRRMQAASNGNPTASTNKSNTFESCFSSGLDLTEFDSTQDNNSNAPRQSAAAELAQMKINAAARIQQEEKEEAELEKRVAGVISSAKSKSSSYQADDERLNVDLRAANPHSLGQAESASSRENNFLQFQTGTMKSDNGFLSSLVQNHESEFKELGGNRRKVAKGGNVRVDYLGKGSSSSKIQARKKEKVRQQSTRNNGKTMGAKKSRKSKF